MKTSFLQRNNNHVYRNRNKKVLVISVLVLLFLLVFFSSAFKGALFTLGKPIWIVRDSTASFFADNSNIFRSKLSLIDENNSLKDQIRNYEREKILSDIIKKENDDLKNILNRGTQNSKRILSAVLVKPFLSPYDTLIIDVGINDGIKIGDKVVAFGSNFIGYIGETYDSTSKVVLYSSYGEKVKVLIGQNYVEKEAIGIGGGNFGVQLPKEADINEGDTISVPSITSNIFAVVEKIQSRENDSFEYILFKSAVNMSELKWVEVILSGKR